MMMTIMIISCRHIIITIIIIIRIIITSSLS